MTSSSELPEMTVRVLQDDDHVAWDHFIARFPSSGPLHTRAWMESFRDARQTPVYLRLMVEDRPVGAIAGLAVDPRMACLRGIDRTLFFFTGPALDAMDSASIRDCMIALRRFARERGFSSLASLGRDYPYGYDWGGSKVHLQTLHEYIVDLRGPWEQVKARMRRSIPEQSRQAARSGLTFHEEADETMLPRLMSLVANTQARRLRKSGKHFSAYYIDHLAEEPLRALCASGIARFFAVRRSSEDLCILLVFTFGARAYALLIGCSDDGYRLRAPAFLWFNALQVLKAAGIEALNLAGGGPQSGHAFFKTSLGAERRECTGSVSPYLKGPVRNLLFQGYRKIDEFITSSLPPRGWFPDGTT